MQRTRLAAPESLLGYLLLACFGCGGGGVSIQPPPPPQPDFTIGFASNSVNVQQGATSSAVDLSINPQNGFTAAVLVTLSDLPTGVNSNPQSPFTINAGAGTQIVFSAAANATTGSFQITAIGTSGSLTHPANLSLNIQAGVAMTLPRAAYIRTDSSPQMDDPAGEPRHRRLAYDPAHQLLFAANRAMNRVEIFSTATASRTGQVSVPGASSVDLSLDGSTAWVGSITEQIAAIDTSSLEIKSRYEIYGLQPLPNTLFDRPEELFALSSGKLMMRLRQSQTGEGLLAIWDPGSNTLTNLTSTEPQLFQNGLGAMARTDDHSKVMVGASDASGEIAVYDANGSVLAGPHGLGAGTISLVAGNPDGSRFAIVFTSNGSSQVLLLDGSLNQQGFYPTSAVNGLTFSRDGQFLYVSENAGAPPVITVLDGRTLNRIGQVPDLWIAGRRSEIEEADSTSLLFGIANRGVSFLDAANPGSLPANAPFFAAPPAAQPSEGPSTGGTAVVLAGQNFGSTAQLAFGSQQATNLTVTGANQINATSPPSTTNGAVNTTAYFPGGWLGVAPDAFSYGPQILQVLPNAGSPAGADTIQIYGHGFGSDATKLTIKIGDAVAAVQKLENITTIAASLGLDATYPFPLERVTLQSPAGTPGKKDIVVMSPSGTITATKAFQYVQTENFYAKPSFAKFVIYDQPRQRLYLSDVGGVDTFDISSNVLNTNSFEPPGGLPPDSQIRGLALTPDGQQLVAADFGAQNVYPFNPDNLTGQTVSIGGVAGFADSGPSRVAATSTQSVFVGLGVESGSSSGCTSCLGQMSLSASPPTIQPASQPEVMSLTGAPFVQSSGDGSQVFVAFGSAPGGPLALWNAASPNQFQTFTANDSATDVATAADGTMFALQTNGTTEVRGADFSLAAVPANVEIAQIPGRVAVPGINLHPSGALLYEPFLTGPAGNAGVQGGVDIFDAHSGALRLRILLQQQFMTDVDGMHGSFLTIDENGQKLFAITSKDGTAQNAGVTVVALAKVPLGIGAISPAQGAAAGGTTLTIRGSGFQAGVTVSIGGKNAGTTFKDMNTLTVIAPALVAGAQRITITNPDGETVSLDAAYMAN